MSSAVRRVAFFDVDETLLAGKSIFEFLRHWLALTGDDSRYLSVRATSRRDAAAGVPREELNRRFYRHLAGASHAELLREGRRWYDGIRRSPQGFVRAGLDAVANHKAAGDLVVLVSGSMRPILDPVAADVRADLVLCTELVVASDGTLTGEVVQPMIGPVKQRAVAETMAELGVDPLDCFGYGDHASDLDMLTAVGNPHVIGDDADLVAHARRHDWPVLPATPGPLRRIPVPAGRPSVV
ncbi:HAD-IB family hydrolase [Actinosynnema sp. NPDC051121]